MYKKYLIIYSKQDQAGINIAKALEQFRKPLLNAMKKNSSGFDILEIETDIVDDSGINPEKINNYDFVIFASKHESEKGGKTLSLHAPGNWVKTNNLYGGVDKKVCSSSALFQKQMFEILNRNTLDSELDKEYEVTLECTHHGPLIGKPCVFIEVGATEDQWNDRRAAFILAKTINETIENFEENPYREIAVGIGGPHYCPIFNKIQLNSNVALSHIIPQYVLPIEEEIILESIKKTEEEVDFVLIDWKGCGKSEERERIIEILEKNYIAWKKTSEIEKD